MLVSTVRVADQYFTPQLLLLLMLFYDQLGYFNYLKCGSRGVFQEHDSIILKFGASLKSNGCNKIRVVPHLSWICVFIS